MDQARKVFSRLSQLRIQRDLCSQRARNWTTDLGYIGDLSKFRRVYAGDIGNYIQMATSDSEARICFFEGKRGIRADRFGG